MLTTSMYLIGVGGYIINPAHIAFVNLDGENLTIAFAAPGGAGAPLTITLQGADAEKFVQMLHSHSPIHK
jgi:hypothetical protein